MTLEKDDRALIEAAAVVLEKSVAELGRALMKGEMGWSDVVKAARKGKR